MTLGFCIVKFYSEQLGQFLYTNEIHILLLL